MPASMAACRTVFPLLTVTWCPSMVSVTVSISGRSYQPVAVAGKGGLEGGLPLFEFGECGEVAVYLHFADGHVGGDCAHHPLVGDRHYDVASLTVGHHQTHSDRK